MSDIALALLSSTPSTLAGLFSGQGQKLGWPFSEGTKNQQLGLGPSWCATTLAARLFRDITVLMRRKTVISRKKRGPPATGKGEPILVRVQPGGLKRIDAWIAQQDDKPSRPEAVRRLVDLGLAGTQPIRRRSPKSASMASDLAGKQIDKLSDPSATDEERQQRKRRLLKGPGEFREMRGNIGSKLKS